jgi:hypothetical protein
MLTEADQNRFREQRSLVERCLGNAITREKFKTAAGKLGTIRAILQAGLFKAEQGYELQCLGTVFGDALVEEMGMEWIIVEDEHGREPALRHAEANLIVYPITMISKRIEAGEWVDVFELCQSVLDQVEELQYQPQ